MLAGDCGHFESAFHRKRRKLFELSKATVSNPMGFESYRNLRQILSIEEIHLSLGSCSCVYMNELMSVCMYVRTYVRTYTCLFVCLFVCLSVCLFVCLFVVFR